MATLLAASLLGGCARSPGPVSVTPPTATAPGDSAASAAPVAGAAAVAAACARLHAVLPTTLGDRHRRTTSPASTRTAAWGNPAVVLRCGVAKPAQLTATSQLVEIAGSTRSTGSSGSAATVSWLVVERPAAYVFTSVGLDVDVQVRVPVSVPREQATAPLADLAAALSRTLR